MCLGKSTTLPPSSLPGPVESQAPTNAITVLAPGPWSESYAGRYPARAGSMAASSQMVATQRPRSARRMVSKVGRTKRRSGCPSGKRGSTRSGLERALRSGTVSLVVLAERREREVGHGGDEVLGEAPGVGVE